MVVTHLQHIACCKSFITIFYFCGFRCVIMPLTGLINFVFLHLYLLFYYQFSLQERVSKQSHSHRAEITIFSFLFKWPLKLLIPRIDTKYVGWSWPIGSRNVTTLTFQGHVTSSVTWPFESQWAISYWWSIGTKSVSPAVFEIEYYKAISILWSRPWPSRVTWRHRLRDHLIPR